MAKPLTHHSCILSSPRAELRLLNTQEVKLVSGSASETDVYIPSDKNQPATLTLYDASGNLVGSEQVSVPQRVPEGKFGGGLAGFVVSYLAGKVLDFAWDHRKEIIAGLGYGPGKPTPPGGVPGFGPPPPPPINPFSRNLLLRRSLIHRPIRPL